MSYEVLEVPPPRLAAERVPELVGAHWGVTGEVRALSSERDLNYLVGGHVLKVANPAEDPALVDMEVAGDAARGGRRPGPPDPAGGARDRRVGRRHDRRRRGPRVPGPPHHRRARARRSRGTSSPRTSPSRWVPPPPARPARCAASSTPPAGAARWTGRYAPSRPSRRRPTSRPDDPLREVVRRVTRDPAGAGRAAQRHPPRRRHPDQPARHRRPDHRGHRLRRHAPHRRRRGPRGRAHVGAAQHQRHPGLARRGSSRARRCGATSGCGR